MLVLTRARDQEIRIGDEIVIRVLDVKGDRVRIGIQAPGDVPVHRQEVYEDIVRANQEALSVAASGLAAAQQLFGKEATATETPDRPASPAQSHSSVAARVEPCVPVTTEVDHGT